MTPTGIALKVTINGQETFPSYEAFGWDAVNEVIKLTREIDGVQAVEIVNINAR